MKINKIILCLLLVSTLILGCALGATASTQYEKIMAYIDNGITLKLHGKDFNPIDAKGSPIKPINYNGSTYLPLRAIAEATGLPVEWDNETRTATLGYSSIQLNNMTSTSFVNIEVSGNLRPTYLTPIKKTYNNWFMGVNFEIRNTEGLTLDALVNQNKKELEKIVKSINITSIELDGLKGQLIDFESTDSQSQRVILISNNSDEYYIIEVFIEKSKYAENKSEFEGIFKTFEKQR